MAVFAQGNAGVLPVLLDVVGIAWPRRITDRAWQQLDSPHMFALLCGELVIHPWTQCGSRTAARKPARRAAG